MTIILSEYIAEMVLIRLLYYNKSVGVSIFVIHILLCRNHLGNETLTMYSVSCCYYRLFKR